MALHNPPPRSIYKRLVFHCIIGLLAATVSAGTPGCSQDPLCPDPNAPTNCGCGGPCEVWQACREGKCIGGNTPTNCGPDSVACTPGQQCVAGACECDEASANTQTACGCPAVNCLEELIDQEMCAESQEEPGTFECICDPDLHKDSASACGCPSVKCGERENCVEGMCECIPERNLDNSLDCACAGPCEMDEVCQTGSCVCGPGTIRCGEGCIPLTFQCCSEDGEACGAGSTCEAQMTEVECRPSGSIACYDHQGAYAGFCGPGAECFVKDDATVECVPSEYSLCPASEPGLPPLGVCPQGYLCTFDGGCIPPAWSLCGDGVTVCDPSTTCQLGKNGYLCHSLSEMACVHDGIYQGSCPSGQACHFGADDSIACLAPGNTACYSDGYYSHSCQAAYTCFDGGCVPPMSSLCADGNTVCGTGTACQKTAQGYGCNPNGTTPCYDSGNYIGFCEAGYTCGPNATCLPPSWTLCGDEETSCPPGQACQLAKGGYVCQKPNTVACFNDSYFDHSCESGYACTKNGCVPPGWNICADGVTTCAAGSTCQKTKGGGSCSPGNTVPCYDSEGYYVNWCSNFMICAVDVNNWIDCVPTNYTMCFDENKKYTHKCPPQKVCTANSCE